MSVCLEAKKTKNYCEHCKHGDEEMIYEYSGVPNEFVKFCRNNIQNKQGFILSDNRLWKEIERFQLQKIIIYLLENQIPIGNLAQGLIEDGTNIYIRMEW